MDVITNALARVSGGYPPALTRFLSLDAARAARDEICGWAGYRPTPLIDLVDLAEQCSVARIAYKDEASRFGLGSFKALGGAYAIARLVGAASADTDRVHSDAPLTVCTATDGNHGRSLAWGARRFGLRCVIYLHRGVSQERERAILALGAETRRVDGNYDDSVRAAEEDAKRHGWTMVSDTSHPGYIDIPCDVMQGYTMMVDEVLEAGFIPTHVFVQGGVGGLAAAVCAHFWESLGSAAPHTIVVEPERADCLFQSALAGEPVAVGGDLDTVMAGLACGEVSEVAWQILSLGAGHFARLRDVDAVAAMRLLAKGGREFPPIIAGESATAGLAAFLIAARGPGLRQELAIDSGSRILCIGTEGASDPSIYEDLVGRSADEVERDAVTWRPAGAVGFDVVTDEGAIS